MWITVFFLRFLRYFLLIFAKKWSKVTKNTIFAKVANSFSLQSHCQKTAGIEDYWIYAWVEDHVKLLFLDQAGLADLPNEVQINQFFVANWARVYIRKVPFHLRHLLWFPELLPVPKGERFKNQRNYAIYCSQWN